MNNLHLFPRIALSSNVSDSRQAGQMFITSVGLTDGDFDASTQISVALISDALTIDSSEWDVFTHVDFIVSSPSYQNDIRANGTSSTSEDVTGVYNSDSLNEPYLAASIQFDYFIQTGGSARNYRNYGQYGGNFIKFIIGNGKCSEKAIGTCQNNALLSDTNYMYAYSLYKLRLFSNLTSEDFFHGWI